MHRTLLAVVHPDNTPHGYNLTFAFPMLMFIIVAGVLYLLVRSTHQVPGHVALESSRWATAGSAGPAGSHDEPDAGAAGSAEPGPGSADGPAETSTEDSE